MRPQDVAEGAVVQVAGALGLKVSPDAVAALGALVVQLVTVSDGWKGPRQAGDDARASVATKSDAEVAEDLSR